MTPPIRPGISALWLGLLVAGCGGARPPLLTHRATIHWPPPPERARIDYVGQIRGPQAAVSLADVLAGGAELPSLVRPVAVTTTPSGLLVVADTGRQAVHLFDLETQEHRLITQGALGPIGLPVGLAADGDSNIYVADGGAVLIFDREGEPTGALTEGLTRPTGLACDRRKGVLYISDTAAHRIVALRLSDRHRLWSVGGRGVEPGQFNYPTYLALSAHSGELLVSDTLNFRVQRLQPDGHVAGVFGRLGDSTGAQARSKGIATDSEGHIYVVDALFSTIQVFSETGDLLLYFGQPGDGPGGMAMPSGLFIDEQDRIFVANALNHRVEVFRYLSLGPGAVPTPARAGQVVPARSTPRETR